MEAKRCIDHTNQLHSHSRYLYSQFHCFASTNNGPIANSSSVVSNSDLVGLLLPGAAPLTPPPPPADVACIFFPAAILSNRTVKYKRNTAVEITSGAQTSAGGDDAPHPPGLPNRKVIITSSTVITTEIQMLAPIRFAPLDSVYLLCCRDGVAATEKTGKENAKEAVGGIRACCGIL
jgi:hypothetical protein